MKLFKILVALVLTLGSIPVILTGESVKFPREEAAVVAMVQPITTTTVSITTTTTTEPPRPVVIRASRGGSITGSVDDILRRIAYCETGGTMNPKIVSKSGKHRGLFQFDIPTWLSNGGGEFAQDPIDATYEQQFEIARRLYSRRGAQPWPRCGRR